MKPVKTLKSLQGNTSYGMHRSEIRYEVLVLNLAADDLVQTACSRIEHNIKDRVQAYWYEVLIEHH